MNLPCLCPLIINKVVANTQNLAWAESTAFCKDLLVERKLSRWGLTSIKIASFTDRLLSDSPSNIMGARRMPFRKPLLCFKLKRIFLWWWMSEAEFVECIYCCLYLRPPLPLARASLKIYPSEKNICWKVNLTNKENNIPQCNLGSGKPGTQEDNYDPTCADPVFAFSHQSTSHSLVQGSCCPSSHSSQLPSRCWHQASTRPPNSHCWSYPKR